MPVFKIHHITKYEYDRPVRESVNEIKIFPYIGDGQEILMQELLITGQPEVQVFIDYWGNKIGLFNVLVQHKELVIESKLVIRTTTPSELSFDYLKGFDDLQTETDGDIRLLELSTADHVDSQELINVIAKEILAEDKTVAITVSQCATYIYKNFQYVKGITNISTTVDEILAHHSGVCQDFAHLMLQILRTLNIPARYVSGYICPNKNGMRGEGATHAWVEAYLPGHGWAGIDPTNNVWVTNTHVKLAVGRHFNDCTPIKGTFKGPAKQLLSVYVSVAYEDGNTFEEKNHVQLRLELSTPDEVLIDETFAAQQ